jgi:hypothetical protein
MSVYYKKLIDLYEAGKIHEYMGYFEQWKTKHFLRKKEIRILESITPSWFEELKGNLNFNNNDIMIRFFFLMKEREKLEDEDLCKKIGISLEDMSYFRSTRKMKSNKVVNKIVREFFRLLRHYSL